MFGVRLGLRVKKQGCRAGNHRGRHGRAAHIHQLHVCGGVVIGFKLGMRNRKRVRFSLFRRETIRFPGCDRDLGLDQALVGQKLQNRKADRAESRRITGRMAGAAIELPARKVRPGKLVQSF